MNQLFAGFDFLNLIFKIVIHIFFIPFLPLFPDLIMSQVEKKAGLLRRTSSSKKPLKEKVVLMYDEIFAVSVTMEKSVGEIWRN